MKSQAKSVFETLLIVAVVLAFAVMPLVTKAESHQRHSPPPLSEFDKDGDGFISEDEFNTTRAARMAAKAEAGKPMKGAATAPSFSDVDTDGDGRVSEAELTAAQQAHMKAMRAEHDGAGKGMGKGKNMPTFADIDTDADSCISAEEFAAHQATHHRHGQD
jgi:hypothetical protein